MSAVFQDFTVNVKQAYEKKQNTGLLGMARNTAKVAGAAAPYRSMGGLKGNRVKIQNQGDVVKVVWLAVYAAYQNRGKRADGTHVVKKYTTAGTGKGFVDLGVKDSIKNIGSFFK